PAPVPSQVQGATSGSGIGRFRLQVGVFAEEASAQNMVIRLRNVGLSPAYEIVNNYYRVVIAGVPATELDAITRLINAAGFTDILIRTEP
ncbi:MAG: SPOR domain-containing protein, partial [Spirochaetaceae bacterium]|nr:SPOR domain-containing protein [Spirochaetaceae bacterium]